MADRKSRHGAHGRHAGNPKNSPQGQGSAAQNGNPYSRTNADYTNGRRRQNAQQPQQGNFIPAGQTPYSRGSANYSSSKKRMSRGKKIALIVVCVILVMVLGAGAALAWYVNGINQTLKNVPSEQAQAIAEVTDPVKNFNEPFYMLLIGSDARVGDESMGARSDTNILTYVDPVENKVTMVSIPRDTMIEIDGNTEKFNAAYGYNGAASTIKEANELCGVKISHYAEVNFEELVSLIDAVGGVEVDVPEMIDDPDAGNVVIQEGLQTLNGEQALTFARSRAYADGDFTRTSNQRLLVEALINKMLSLPVTELPGVIDKAAQCVTTDLSVTDIVSLASQFQDATDGVEIYSAMVPSTTAMIDGVSYVLTDDELLKKMMEMVEAGEDPATLDTSTLGQGVDWSKYGLNESYANSIDNSGSATATGPDDSSAYYEGGGTYQGPAYAYSDSGYVEPSYGGGGGYDPSYGGGTVDSSGTGGLAGGTGSSGAGSSVDGSAGGSSAGGGDYGSGEAGVEGGTGSVGSAGSESAGSAASVSGAAA